MNNTFFLTGFIAILGIISCERLENEVKDSVILSPREAYLKKFSPTDSTFLHWQAAYDRAKQDSIAIKLPYSMSTRWLSGQPFAYGYECTLEKGRLLVITHPPEQPKAEIFVEIFWKDSSHHERFLPRLSESLADQNTLSYFIRQSGTYKVMIQPTMSYDTSFVFQIYDQPAFEFPVAGANNRSIQSFWGDPREGGKRKHHGIDIFAKRGTPVIAVGDGYIRYTGERGLGGKQVWMREEMSNSSIYYAHLDSILERPSRRVRRGDTLGFVGNTGNARTTAPHLHFGIYERRRGPTNPLAFVRQVAIPQPYKQSTGPPRQFLTARGNLRMGPGTQYPVRSSINNSNKAYVLGQHKEWYQVAYSDSLQGYVHRSIIQEVE